MTGRMAGLMLAGALGCLFLARALGGTRAAWAFAFTPLLAGAVLRTHYDLLAALVLLGALLAFARTRPVLGMALLGAGAMVKGFPLVLVPIAAAWTWRHARRRGRSPFLQPVVLGLASCAAVVVVVSAPFLGDGYVDAYRFHLDRPIQVESTRGGRR